MLEDRTVETISALNFQLNYPPSQCEQVPLLDNLDRFLSTISEVRSANLEMLAILPLTYPRRTKTAM